jgi:hypothetical protein
MLDDGHQHPAPATVEQVPAWWRFGAVRQA